MKSDSTHRKKKKGPKVFPSGPVSTRWIKRIHRFPRQRRGLTNPPPDRATDNHQWTTSFLGLEFPGLTWT